MDESLARRVVEGAETGEDALRCMNLAHEKVHLGEPAARLDPGLDTGRELGDENLEGCALRVHASGGDRAPPAPTISERDAMEAIPRLKEAPLAINQIFAGAVVSDFDAALAWSFSRFGEVAPGLEWTGGGEPGDFRGIVASGGEQAPEGGPSVQVLLPDHEVERGEQDLAGDEPVTAEGPVVGGHQPALADGGRGLRGRAGVAGVRAASSDGRQAQRPASEGRGLRSALAVRLARGGELGHLLD